MVGPEVPMSRLSATFDTLRHAERKALVVYLTAGDPDSETSITAALAAVEAGADVLEIGVPFSDPIADGPVIQRAMVRALAGGGGLDAALEVVRRVREKTDVPIVLFGYLNPLLWHGLDATCARVAAAGADALLVVDVPPEESEEPRAAAAAAGLDWVALVAPTTGADRVAAVAAQATGFVYVVSMTGVTGGALDDTAGVSASVEAVRAVTELPVCVGFGVRDRDSAMRVASVADGVVVGSAVVSALESADGVAAVQAKIAELRAGADAAGQGGA